MKALFATATLACISLSGCGPDQTIDAKALNGVVRPVLERHDEYVEKDSSLQQVERDTYLRSSELVRQLVDEALAE